MTDAPKTDTQHVSIDITDIVDDPTLTHAEVEAKIAERQRLADVGLWTNPIRPTPPLASENSIRETSDGRAYLPFAWPARNHYERFHLFTLRWDIASLWVWLEQSHAEQGGTPLQMVAVDNVKKSLAFIGIDRNRLADDRAQELDLQVPLLYVKMCHQLGGGHQLIDGAHRLARAAREARPHLSAILLDWREALPFMYSETDTPLNVRDVHYVHPACDTRIRMTTATLIEGTTGLKSMESYFSYTRPHLFGDGVTSNVTLPVTHCPSCATRLTLNKHSGWDNERVATLKRETVSR